MVYKSFGKFDDRRVQYEKWLLQRPEFRIVCSSRAAGSWRQKGYAEEGSDMQQWFFEEMERRRVAIDQELSDFVTRLRDEKETHYYCSKAEKEDWWMQAGFVQVNVLWQYLCIALMAGRKPF